jgi:hypothetical protein
MISHDLISTSRYFMGNKNMEIFQQLGVFVEVETHGAPMGP